MAWAIFQNDLEKPDVDILTDAFRTVPSLTDTDAAILARDAYGVLVEGISQQDAQILQNALRARNIVDTAVEQNEVPRLPGPKALRKAECRPDAFVLIDLYDRQHPVPWSSVRLVTAGSMMKSESVRKERTRYVLRGGPAVGHGAMPIALTDVEYKREEQMTFLVDLFLDMAPARYQIDAANFFCNPPETVRPPTPKEKFVFIASQLVESATDAWLNRGAAALKKDRNTVYHYPNTHAYDEEIRWLVWQSDYRLPAGN